MNSSNPPVGKLLNSPGYEGYISPDGFYVPAAAIPKPASISSSPAPAPTPTIGNGGFQTTSPAPATPINPAGDPPTTVFIDSLVQPNCLNAYWQTTYRFKLWMSKDVDIITNVENTYGSVSDYPAFLKGVGSSSIPKVVIAESGVTGYNIKDVEINTVIAQNAYLREQTGTTFSMTITEPLGISFLDALYGAASLLGMADYTKGVYYLECSFLGYDDNGNPKNPAEKFPNGGVWIWAVQLTDVHTKVDENGGAYKLNFVITDAAPIILANKVMSPQVLNKQLKIKGATVGDMLNDYADKLTKAWKSEYDTSGKSSGLPIYKFHIDTSIPIHAGPGKGKIPSKFQITPDSRMENPTLHHALETVDGLPTMTIDPGTTINEVITSVIKSSKDGRLLILDEKVDGNLDLSNSQVNDRGYRETVLFSIETDIKNSGDQESQTGNNCKDVTLQVRPFYTQGVIASRPQVDNATKDGSAANVQRNMVESYAKNGFINKRYDYIFTGLNTEVIEFNIEFNLAWQAQLPKMAGAYLDYRAQRVNKKLNAVNLNKKGIPPMPENYTQVLNTLTHVDPVQYIPLDPGNAGFADDIPSDLGAISIGTAATSSKSTPPVDTTNPPQMTSGTVYIEDVLTKLNQNQAPPVLPISFNHGWQDPKRGEGVAPRNDFGRGVPLTGAAVMQEYNKTLATGAFQTAKVTVRGDPFWLGQTNLQRQIEVRHHVAYTPQTNATPGANLPDWVSGNQVILLRFQYPSQIGDDSTPVLKESIVFNGLYEVTIVKHTFSDGTFKQELNAVRLPLINVAVALGTKPPNGKVVS